jgi:hemolysin activation/secretion protein
MRAVLPIAESGWAQLSAKARSAIALTSALRGRSSPSGRITAVLALAAFCAVKAYAQPVERNLPPAPSAPPSVIAAPPLPLSIDDDRSLGATLTSIVLLGPTSSVATGLSSGVDTRAVARLNRSAARRSLRRFLGRSISRKLIGEIETAIVRAYRRQGFPFVEVSTPEQEISHGVLQIRVVEFRVGKLAVTGADARGAATIGRGLRTRPGDEIDSATLSQDLDWLNRYPDRIVSPTFTAGAALGETDLDLAVTSKRPWSLVAGFANSGSPATSEDRVFIGGSLAGHLLTDEVLSVQITGSPDFWADQGRPLSDRHPFYESAAGRLQVATAPRQDIELTLNAVETNEAVFPFVIRQQTLEATLGYRSALSDLVPLPGDVSGGVEVSRQARHTFFGGVSVLEPTVDIFQIYGDWSNHWSDRFGASSLDISVHGSPGGVDGLDTGAAFANFTNGRVTDSAYVYGQANITRQTLLPHGFSLLTQFSGQYAGRPIPDSQQIALGGQTAVRGYTLDDGAWDDGAVLLDELHAPLLPLVRRGPAMTSLDPCLFVDVGYGRNEASRLDTRIASVGFGADLRLGAAAIASLDVSRALTNAKVTRAGDVHLDARLTIAY